MRITICCVGKVKEKFYCQAIDEYSKRLSRYCKLEVKEVADEKTPDNASDTVNDIIKAKEGERLLSCIKDEAYVIALAIDGKMLDSVQLSQKIDNLGISGKSDIVFVIGGSLGLDKRVLDRADFKLSFSPMTFPHQLMRVILLEQIYRSYRIMKNEPYHIIIVAVAAVLVFMKFFNGNLLYISTGMGKSVVMKVDGQKTYTFEAEVLMSDAKKQYEDMFGSSIWTEDIAGQPFEEYIKEQIRVKLIRVRCMNSMAKERGVVLGREEKNETAKAAEQYFDGLTEEQKSQYDITEDKVNQMFTEFAIASKLYNDVTSLMDIEVSSDDARVINIQYIVTDSKEEIDKAYAELNEGNSFFAIAKKYNADGEYEYELRRGEMAKAFEDTAYSLSTGQTSGIVEADGRFYIIRCTSDNDKAKTEVNKSSILEKKKLEAFNDKFEQYESSKYVEINKDEWNKLKVSSAPSFNVRFEDLFNSITIN